MNWNYRIVRYPDGRAFALHEVYYDENGKPLAMTVDPATFVAVAEDSPETVIEALKMALKDAENSPVFDPPKEWFNKEGNDEDHI